MISPYVTAWIWLAFAVLFRITGRESIERNIWMAACVVCSMVWAAK